MSKLFYHHESPSINASKTVTQILQQQKKCSWPVGGLYRFKRKNFHQKVNP